VNAYLGVDWSATEIVCAVVGEEGSPISLPGGTPPELAKVRKLIERARALVPNADEVHAMIEAGASGWVSMLHCAGAIVHVVDPKQAKRFAESRGSSGAKDDRRDAALLAEMCRSPAHRKPAWEPDSPEMQQLDVLGGLHEQLSTDLGRVKQRLREVLRQQMPLVERALPKELRTAWVGRLLKKAPTPLELKALTREEFDELVTGSHAKTQDRVWDAISKTDALGLVPSVARIVGERVRIELDQMVLLGKQLDRVEKRMDRLTRDMRTRRIGESMAGIAMRLATSLILFAFRDGIPADRDVASIRMGSSPVFVGSGRRKDGRVKGIVRMRLAAPARARRATYLMGRLAMCNLDWAKAMYADAMERGQSSATAFRRIARCVLRIQSAMMRSGEPYDDAKYVATLKSKGVRWAAAL
jgi:transposase